MLKHSPLPIRIRHRLAALEGHLYTIAPVARSLIFPAKAPPCTPWKVETTDNLHGGKILVTGAISHHPESSGIVVLVHGLGGSIESEYVVRMARRFYKRRHSVLRLNMRGADRRGDTMHHAGLYDDILLALRDKEVSRYQQRWVLGFSMGGHASLWAAKHHPNEMSAVATLCSPLDLAQSQIHIDSPAVRPYRLHILRGLKDVYGAFARRHQGPVSLERANSIRTLLDWDSEIIAPLFGFTSAQDYYAKQSAFNALPSLKVPVRIVCAEHDPMVSAKHLRPHLSRLFLMACPYNGCHGGDMLESANRKKRRLSTG